MKEKFRGPEEPLKNFSKIHLSNIIYQAVTAVISAIDNSKNDEAKTEGSNVYCYYDNGIIYIFLPYNVAKKKKGENV